MGFGQARGQTCPAASVTRPRRMLSRVSLPRMSEPGTPQIEPSEPDGPSSDTAAGSDRTPENRPPADRPPADVLKPGTRLRKLPGVGPALDAKLERLGLRTCADLLRHYPLRYEFESAESGIADLPIGGVGSARGTVEASRVAGVGRKARFEFVLTDGHENLLCTFFNAAWLRKKISPGMHLRVQGKTKLYRHQRQMVSPLWEIVDDETGPDADADIADPTEAAAGDRFRPVYPATEGLTSTRIEELAEPVLRDLLPALGDPFPDSLRAHHNFPTLRDALRMIHRPADADEAGTARRRLAFNELFLLQLGVALKRAYVREALQAPALEWSEATDRHIADRFPFPMTGAQAAVTRQIAADLQRTEPMNRLLQGDVGAGKTVVALYAMLMAVMSGRQAALMAPTELLAEQHYRSISRMLASDSEHSRVRVALVTGSRPEDRDAVERGDADLVIGTHALISASTRFRDLAVAVIDEQHRFGVRQRARFRGDDADAAPHTLVMTATPIPRTLSLTLFGDLDVSVLDELPPGRTPIANRVVGPDKEDAVYDYAAERLERGEQVYVVCPAVEENAGVAGPPLRNVSDQADWLAERGWDRFGVERVHGRLSAEERAAAMERFGSGTSKVLVATTVIEVGVDVPAATVMIIEHAERFGLAQLHQLRGRVGRGSSGAKPLCVFMARNQTEDGRRRLDAISGTNDGFRIAEADLEIRGMGEFFGTRQSGLPPLKLARIPDDMDLLQMARRDARAIIEADPRLADPLHADLKTILFQQFGEALGLVDIA